MNFPDIALLNKFYIGDSVLLEPMADSLAEQTGRDVYIISRFSEIFWEHPRVVGLQPEGPFPPNLRTIDMSEAISSMRMTEFRGKPVVEFIPNKFRRLWEAAGMSEVEGKSPALYLSQKERAKAAEMRGMFGEKCIGLVLHSNMPVKIWPYMRQLMKAFTKAGHDVFAISDNLRKGDGYVLDYRAYRVIGKPFRELMVYLSFMDLLIGSDTGPMHIGAALGVPSIVLTREFWKDLWPYENCRVIGSKHMSVKGMHAIGPRKVKRLADSILELEPKKRGRVVRRPDETVALFRLDGLGGSITLTDHAKKIYEMTGRKSTVIVRGYGMAFRDNPYIRDVIEVGYVRWSDCIAEMTERYPVLAEIRFAPALWHQSNGRIFDQDFAQSQELFDRFPDRYNELEIHGLHHVQLTDKYLGLPYDTIDMEVYYTEQPDFELPDKYVVMADGVDVQHGSMRQTKTWSKWSEFAEICPLPVLQLGARSDPYNRNTVDLRGKTSVAEMFYILKNAAAVVCTEGGLMHAAYAARAESVLVLRGPTRGKLFEYPGHIFMDSYVCDICWSSKPDWYENCPKGIAAACMETISPERVAYKLQEVLDGAEIGS